MAERLSPKRIFLHFPSPALGNRGFNLLEITIALAMLALIFSGLYAAYSNTLDGAARVEESSQAEQMARLALMQLKADFDCLIYQEFNGDSGASPYRFRGGGDQTDEAVKEVVEFASTAQPDIPESFPDLGVNRIRYLLEKDPESGGYYRIVRRELPFADLSGESQERAVELADRVKEFTLRYFDAAGQQASQWDSSPGGTEGPLPRLVQIRLRIAGKDSRWSQLYTLLVALPSWQGKAVSSEQ